MALPLFLLIPDTASAGEASEIWSESITPAWLDDHIVAASAPVSSRSSYRLSRTRIWASGLGRSDMHAFAATGSDRVVGAQLLPFPGLDLMIGATLTRSSGEQSLLSSAASWEASWSHDWQRLGNVTIDVSTTGLVDSLQAGYSQAVNGSVHIPLGSAIAGLQTEFRFSPSMNFDLSSRAFETGLTSEIVGQTALGGWNKDFESTLSLTLGYHLSPGERPVASAGLELRISPSL